MAYTSDLTDDQWSLISYCFPRECKTGRPRLHAPRHLLDAIFYVTRTGCQWRNLPENFPPWGTVYHYFRTWNRSGLTEQIHTHLRESLRLEEGRRRNPSAAIIDSQSVKSTESCSDRGYDAGKKVKGRKRHIAVDTMGLLLLVLVLPADVQDRDAARQLLGSLWSRRWFRGVRHIWADGGYAGALVDWIGSVWRRTLEIVRRSDRSGFHVLPRRWVVERTFAWMGRYRRLNRDYECRPETAEAFAYLAMSRLMLTRLGRHA